MLSWNWVVWPMIRMGCVALQLAIGHRNSEHHNDKPRMPMFHVILTGFQHYFHNYCTVVITFSLMYRNLMAFFSSSSSFSNFYSLVFRAAHASINNWNGNSIKQDTRWRRWLNWTEHWRDTRYNTRHTMLKCHLNVFSNCGLGNPIAATLDDLFGYFVARRLHPIGMVVMAPSNKSLPRVLHSIGNHFISDENFEWNIRSDKLVEMYAYNTRIRGMVYSNHKIIQTSRPIVLCIQRKVIMCKLISTAIS